MLAFQLPGATIDLTQQAIRNTPEVRLNGDNVRIDRLGIWNIWPNYAGIEFPFQNLDGKPVEFRFNFSPAETAIGWIDGHLFSLNNAQDKEVLRVDMVRRGRFRLHWAGKKVISRQQDWSCTVVHWENLAPRDLSVKIVRDSVALIMGNETILKLTGTEFTPGEYTVFLGKKRGEEGHGAHGWYRSYETCSSDTVFPPVQKLPGDPAWAARVEALDRFFVTPEMDSIPYDPKMIRYYDARTAAAYVALDGLWHRLIHGEKRGFEFFVTELEQLAAEVKAGKVADYTIDVGEPQSKPDFFLAPNDSDFYYGVCGWGLGSYAPELARMGYNLVSEHIWPNALLDNFGNPMDCMMIRSVMPKQEVLAKYGIKFDLMIAPYTPNYLLKQHPEWEGTFFGWGMENEAENLKKSAAEWKGRMAGHGFLKASVISPDYIEMCKRFLDYMLPFLRDSQAVAAIDLANEIQLEDYTPRMQERFREFLCKKYSSIESLNCAWGTDYASFKDILMTRPQAFDRRNTAQFWDWVLVNREVGNEHFAYLQELCRQNAPHLPTHVKHLPYEFGMPWFSYTPEAAVFFDYADGIDRKTLAQMTDIIGTDSWADNGHDATGRLSADVTSYQTAYLNLLRSYAPAKWIFDSEWHIIRCDPPATRPACLDMVMQQNAVHGLKAGTFWVCSPGNGQHLELSSTAPLLLQGGLTSAKIRSQRNLFNALANRSKRLGVLYSPKSRHVGDRLHITQLHTYMEAAAFSGVEPRMIDERQLINGEVTAKDLDLLVVLDCVLPMDETPSALRKFAADGGKMILYGRFGTKLAQRSEFPEFLRTSRFETDSLKLVEQIQRDAAEFGCAPEYRITAPNGSVIWGIEYHSAKLPDGRNVIYIANMSKETRQLKIMRNNGLTREIELMNWETKLIVE